MTPDDKWKSMTMEKYSQEAAHARAQRPARAFEPGFDTVTFIPANETKQYNPLPKAEQGLTMSF